jgi:hypothetical protein
MTLNSKRMPVVLVLLRKHLVAAPIDNRVF